VRSILAILTLALLVAAPLRAQTTPFHGVTVQGVVIAHSPAASELYIGSPTIAVLPNGDYAAAHDLFGPKSKSSSNPTSRVYRSTDRGQTWTPLAAVTGQFYTSLFVHRGDLYLFGCTGVNGHLTVRRSTDGGATWTTPSDKSTGLLLRADETIGYHTSSMPAIVADGRVWRGYESRDRTGGNGNDMSAAVMSAPADADLLDAANWTFSNEVMRRESWLPGDRFLGWREGNVTVAPDGGVVNVLRVDLPAGEPERAAIVRVLDPGTVAFDPARDLVAFNGGAKKFTLRRHERDGYYYALSNIIDEHNASPRSRPTSIRNTVALVRSPDLVHWTVKRVLLRDVSDVRKVGFQYVDWQFDGDDIVAVARSAQPDGLGGAASAHNANFLTFHRFKGAAAASAADAAFSTPMASQPGVTP